MANSMLHISQKVAHKIAPGSKRSERPQPGPMAGPSPYKKRKAADMVPSPSHNDMTTTSERPAKKIKTNTIKSSSLHSHNITPAAIHVLESAGFFLQTPKRAAADMSTSSSDGIMTPTSEPPAKKKKISHDSSSSPPPNTTIDIKPAPLEQGTYFHLFPQLPPELREMIWKECLPNRVIEIDEASPGLPGDSTDKANREPATISLVNEEAAEVAARAQERPCHRDAMHYHWPQWPGNDDSNTQPNEEMSHNMLQLHADIGFKTAMSIPAELLANFGVQEVDKSKKPMWFAGFWGDFAEQHPSFNVVLLRLILHAPHRLARESGLFGHLGDAPVQLVDPEDFDLLQQYRRLSCKAPSSEEHKEDETEAYWYLRDEDVRNGTFDYTARIHYWAARAELAWIKGRWVRAISSGEEDLTLLPRSKQELSVKDWDGRPVADVENPWVKEQLAAMPFLRPKYMIRLCHEECCTSQAPDAPVLKRGSKIIPKDL